MVAPAAVAERSCRAAGPAQAADSCRKKHPAAMRKRSHFSPTLNSSFCLDAKKALVSYAGTLISYGGLSPTPKSPHNLNPPYGDCYYTSTEYYCMLKIKA